MTFAVQSRAWGVALALVASSPALADDHLLRFDADGRLQGALPELNNGDTVTFGVDAGSSLQRHVFHLNYRCIGPAGDWIAPENSPEHPLPNTLVFYPLRGQLNQAMLPEECLNSATRLEWHLYRQDIERWGFQQQVLPLLNILRDVGETALYHANVDMGPEDWRETHARMAGYNAQLAILGDDTYPLDTVIDTGYRFAVADLESHPIAPRDWQDLHDGVARALKPMADRCRGDGEAGGLQKTSATENESESDTEGEDESEASESKGFTRTVTTSTTTTPSSSESAGPSDFISLPDDLGPGDHLAFGELPVGGWHRLVQFDPNHLRPEEVVEGPSEIDERYEVWIAMRNLEPGQGYEAIAIQANALADADFADEGSTFNARGADEGDEDTDGDRPVLPDDKCWYPTPQEPDYRVVLDPMGPGAGRMEYTIDYASLDASDPGFFVRYRVRRTTHLALKSGLAASWIPDRSVIPVTDSAGDPIFVAGQIVTSKDSPDLTIDPVVALAYYPYPHNPISDRWRGGLRGLGPHFYLGWTPEQLLESEIYGGIGFDPAPGLTLAGGAAMGQSYTLAAPSAGYLPELQQGIGVGWFGSVNLDLNVVAALASQTFTAATVDQVEPGSRVLGLFGAISRTGRQQATQTLEQSQ